MPENITLEIASVGTNLYAENDAAGCWQQCSNLNGTFTLTHDPTEDTPCRWTLTVTGFSTATCSPAQTYQLDFVLTYRAGATDRLLLEISSPQIEGGGDQRIYTPFVDSPSPSACADWTDWVDLDPATTAAYCSSQVIGATTRIKVA